MRTENGGMGTMGHRAPALKEIFRRLSAPRTTIENDSQRRFAVIRRAKVLRRWQKDHHYTHRRHKDHRPSTCFKGELYAFKRSSRYNRCGP